MRFGAAAWLAAPECRQAGIAIYHADKMRYDHRKLHARRRCSVIKRKLSCHILVLVLALVVSLCSCSGEDGANTQAENLKSKTPVVQPEDVHGQNPDSLEPNASAPANPKIPSVAPATAQGQTASPAAPGQTAIADSVIKPAAPVTVPASGPSLKTGPLAVSTQIVLVLAPDWKSSKGEITRYERKSIGDPWMRVGASAPCLLGRNGLGWGRGLLKANSNGPQKTEGDGKSPAGAFSLPSAFGVVSENQAKTQGMTLPYAQVDAKTVCVTDPASSSFNKFGNSDKADWRRNDRMSRDSGVNAWGAVIGHNVNDVAAKAGSCVFLNVQEKSGKPSGGSIGCAEPALLDILSWLKPTSHPVLVALPQKEYESLKTEIGLP
jgi:L,D-peptidoglycan transpeptidase YkuD (ErfK/YbiS/YcfS/YnhG family)